MSTTELITGLASLYISLEGGMQFSLIIMLYNMVIYTMKNHMEKMIKYNY